MSFLNNLGQKISDVSQTTIKKTKDLADTAKLNLNISEEEHKINTAYEQIGKWYVEKHREDAEEDAKTWLDAIAASEATKALCRSSSLSATKISSPLPRTISLTRLATVLTVGTTK